MLTLQLARPFSSVDHDGRVRRVVLLRGQVWVSHCQQRFGGDCLSSTFPGATRPPSNPGGMPHVVRQHVRRLLLPLAVVAACCPFVTAGCTSELDCSLAGTCDAKSGECRCVSGFAGPACASLNLSTSVRQSISLPSASLNVSQVRATALVAQRCAIFLAADCVLGTPALRRRVAAEQDDVVAFAVHPYAAACA